MVPGGGQIDGMEWDEVRPDQRPTVRSAHPFDSAIDLQPLDGSRMRGRTHPDWANMVGPFGGITAAVMLRAVELHPDRIGDPLALTVNYAAAIADGDYQITVRAVRTNRTNQHWILELEQGGKVTTTATAVFAVHRDTWGDTENRPPDAAPPEAITPAGLPLGIVWSQRYDMRFVEGPVPTGGRPSRSSTTTLWARDAAGRGVDYPALAALCDIFYPRVFLRRGTVMAASTISLTTYFHADRQQLDAVGGDFVLASAHAHRFHRGYFDQSAGLWSRAGELLASTHQIVYFKD